MGVKGISWIEANFEKLIVVIMLVAFLVVLTFQFVLQSNTVEVGGDKVSLDKAFEPAERAAQRLQAQLADENPQLPGEIETPDLAADFERAISGDVVPLAKFASLGDALTLEINAGETQFVVGEYAPFQPPAPMTPTVATYRATLDPYAVDEIEGLSEMLASEQPFDTPWVSIQAIFDGTMLKASYENDPDGSGGAVSALPASWWSEGAGVLAVELERQQRDIQGQWGAAEPVTSMPGTFDALEDMDERAVNYRLLQNAGGQAALREDQILRPNFVRLLEGEPWVPPTEVPEAGEVGEIQNQTRRLERRLASIDREIEQRKNALTAPTANRATRRENSDSEGGGESRREVPQETTREGSNDQTDARKRNIEANIARLENTRQELVVELEGLGWQPEGVLSANAYDRELYRHEEPLLEANEINLWAHDINVEPGATYRYRVRLVYVNPMFGRKSSLAESLHELADAKLVRSDWTDWSDPASVSWDEYFFLTGANMGGNIGRSSATAELYRFYYGYWRRGTVALAPGDRFVAQIDLPEGLQRWDVERLADEQAWKPPVFNSEDIEEEAEQVEGLEGYLLPLEMPIAANAWLLDVVASPMATTGIGGQAIASFEALVRGSDGLITNRSPRVDEISSLYAIIKSSAQAGEEQLPQIPGQGPRQSGRDGGLFGGDRGFGEGLPGGRNEHGVDDGGGDGGGGG